LHGAYLTLNMKKLIKILKLLNDTIPEGEGSVSLKLFHDGSSRFDLEMYGVDVAYAKLKGLMIRT